MKTLKLIAIAIAITVGVKAYGFGSLGHATVAKIAENHLTETTKAEIAKYLNGQSITEVASWMDQVRRTPEYSHTSGWHSASIDKDGKVRIFSKKKAKFTAGIKEIHPQMANGGYKQLSDSAVATNLKLLVHMIGDVHCPSHTCFEGEGQNFEITVNGQNIAFHKFWDSGIMHLTKESKFEKYAKRLDTMSEAEIVELQKGKCYDWIRENAAICKPLYEIMTPGAEFNDEEGKKFVADMQKIEDLQLQKAGYRLARVLNEIFDPEVTPQRFL